MRTRYYNISGVYQLQSLIDDKKYIGSAIKLHRRKIEHLGCLKKGIYGNILLQRHVNKYRIEDLKFNVLEYCPKEKLIEREQYYIDTLKPEFNLCKIAGSPLGTKKSEESKQKNRKYALLKMSDPINRQILREAALKQFSDPLQILNLSTKAKKRKGIKNPMYNKHHSKQTIKLLREQKLGKCVGKDNPMYGKHHSEKTKQKASIRMEGNLINLNRKHSLKTREKYSKARIEYWDSEKGKIQKEKMAGKNNSNYKRHHVGYKPKMKRTA